MERLNVKAVLILVFATQISFAQTDSQVNTSGTIINPITNCSLRYYYYPNLEAYFDTTRKLFHFKVKSQWQSAEEIPTGYRGYSVYNKYSIFITDYDDDNICQFIDLHKIKYPYITSEKLKKLTVRN